MVEQGTTPRRPRPPGAGGGEKRAITAAAAVVGVFTLLSRVSGLARDVVTGYLFGAGSAADAFFVAFRIPNLFRRLVGEGAVAVAFVPVVTEYLTRRSRAEAMAAVAALGTFMALLLAVLTAAGVVFARPLAVFFAPGFPEPKVELTASLLRITFLYLFFIGLVAVAMGVLHSLRRFAAAAFSPVLLNLAMIGCAVLLAGAFTEPVFSLAYGVVLGGAGQLAVHVVALRRAGVPLRPRGPLLHPAVRRVLLVSLPVLFGTAVYHINIVMGMMFASLLPEGSVSYLWYAGRVFEFPQGIFVVALGTAALPSFAAQAKRDDYEGLGESVGFSLRLLNATVLPAAVGMFVLATPAASVLFHRGEFGAEAVGHTAWALRYYALGLWSVAVVRLISSAFYALEDARAPVAAATVAFVANLVFSLMLMGPLTAAGGGTIERAIAALSAHLAVADLRHAGLALAASLASVVNLVVLGAFLRQRLGAAARVGFVESFGKGLVCALIMAWPVQAVAARIDWLAGGQSLFLRVATLGCAVAVGVAAFGVAAYVLDPGGTRAGARLLAPLLLRFLPQRFQFRR